MSDEFLTIKEAVQFIRECGYDRRMNRIKLWNYSNQGPIGLAGHSSANHSGIDVPPVVNRPSKRLRSEQFLWAKLARGLLDVAGSISFSRPASDSSSSGNTAKG